MFCTESSLFALDFLKELTYEWGWRQQQQHAERLLSPLPKDLLGITWGAFQHLAAEQPP